MMQIMEPQSEYCMQIASLPTMGIIDDCSCHYMRNQLSSSIGWQLDHKLMFNVKHLVRFARLVSGLLNVSRETLR
jgi:hypothetical protein